MEFLRTGYNGPPDDGISGRRLIFDQGRLKPTRSAWEISVSNSVWGAAFGMIVRLSPF